MTKELDLSYLDTLIGTLESGVDAKLLKELSDESFTVAMFRAGFLTAVTDESGVIIGFDFQPPQNFDMLMTGTSGDDNLVAGDGDDIIMGGDGDDTINAGAGDDMLSGGAGNDTLDGGDGIDQVLLDGNLADYAFSFVDENTVMVTDNNGLYGTDTLLNIENFSFLDGDYSRSDLEALINAPSEITGTTGNDVLTGTAGDDIISALEGYDTLYGGDGNDTLYGGTEIDYLYGEAGDDILNGGASIDFLTGGAGADSFVFTAAEAFTGVDRIEDFSIAEGDMLDISDILIGFDPLNDAIADFVQVTDNGTDSFIHVDADGIGGNYSTIATALGTTGLSDVQALLDNGNIIA